MFRSSRRRGRSGCAGCRRSGAQPAYEQGITHVRTRYSGVLLVCEPEVIGEILVEKADAFSRDPATRRSFKPVVGENSIFVAEGAEWRW